MPLSGANALPECFVEGTTVVDECAPANGTGRQPLDEAMKAGAGMDGQEGSLCAVKEAPGSAQARCSALCTRLVMA